MRNIEKKYQQLIKDMEHVYDNAYDTFRNQIEDLESIIQNKNEEIEKLRGGNKLQNEIDEYNRLEAQNNMNLEDEITQLRAENSRLKKAYSDLEKAYKLTVEPASYRLGDETVVHHCGKGEPKVYKPKTRKKRSKSVVVYCKDCGTYFQAKSKIAKYCSSCRDKRAKQSRAKWLAKQKEQK